MADEIVRAVANDRDLRFVAIENFATVAAIAEWHGVKGALLTPLGHIITSAQLLGTLLKGPGAVSVLVESDGILPDFAADANPFGLVRATLPKSAVEDSQPLDLERPFVGKGTLTVERKLADRSRVYRGIVELVSPSLARCINYYMEKSEQIRSFVGLATIFDHRGLVASGGYMVQAFPDTEDSALALMEENLRRMPVLDELFRARTGVDELLAYLADGFDLRIMSRHAPEAYCPCSRKRSAQALSTLGEQEVARLVEEAEELELSCDYCRSVYRFSVEELSDIHAQLADLNGAEGSEDGEPPRMSGGMA